jgi:hypothetical protein
MAEVEQPRRSVEFEEFMAGMREMKARVEEIERFMREREKADAERAKVEAERAAEFKKAEEKFAAEQKRADAKYKKEQHETARQMGYLSRRFGELAEHLVAPNIKEKFNSMGYGFDYVTSRVDVGENGAATEVDILLENGKVSMAVEVKAKPTTADVKEHIERMEKLRQSHRYQDGRLRLMGAIAGAIFPESVRDYTLKCGFYVIIQSGDTVKIKVPSGFTPREW